MKRYPLVVAAVLAVAALGLTQVSAAAGPQSVGRPSLTTTKDVTAHLFQWPWTDVARECTDVLGPAGYAAVQVTPPQEHVVLPANGYPWWQVYQPASYTLDTRYGTPREFAAMVRTCHRAGVKVYVDAVINHMTGQRGGGVGSAGTAYEHFSYPGLYGYDDFHHCGRNGDDTIHNWNDRWEIQNCMLLGLSDLATETEPVRTTVAGYLNRLLALGVDGFRIDAAKHIPAEDLAAINAKLTRPAYLYQEVLGNAPIAKSEYTPNGHVIEDGYGQQFGRVFKTGRLDWLSQFGEVWGLAPGATSIVYVDSHDSERDSSGTILTYKDGPLMDLATVFSLAWPYGHPLLLSSYGFTSSDAGPPSGAGGEIGRVSCNTVTSGAGGWLCQHRAPSATGLVGFRNTVGPAAVTRWWSNGNNAIGFAREGKGYVVINRESAAVSATFDTGLPAGTYCNLARGSVRSGRCTGPTVTIDGAGALTTSVAGLTALAISVDSRVRRPSAAPPTAVAFHAYATLDKGQRLYVVGSAPELGAWDPARAVPLDSAAYPNWLTSVRIPAGTPFEYRYLKKSLDCAVVWETRSNRTATVPADGSLALADGWEAGATVSAAITLHVTTNPGQSLFIVGSVPALGSWDPGSAVALTQADANTWTGTVTLPGSQFVEYKYIRRTGDGGVIWESDPNRTITTPSGGDLTLDETWR